MITFDVLGRPAPQGSKVSYGRGRIVESSQYVLPWREAIKAAIMIQRIPLTKGAIAVSTEFRFTRPKSHYGTGRNAGNLKVSAEPYPVGQQYGDLDKLERAVFDALTQGGAIVDDKYVVASSPSKRWCAPDEPQGAWISITSA